VDRGQLHEADRPQPACIRVSDQDEQPVVEKPRTLPINITHPAKGPGDVALANGSRVERSRAGVRDSGGLRVVLDSVFDAEVCVWADAEV
jgi:hypothetical protein